MARREKAVGKLEKFVEWEADSIERHKFLLQAN